MSLSPEVLEAVQSYKWAGHEPNSRPIGDLHPTALSELLVPYPSIQFRNFPYLNQITGGLRPYEFTILCGATGTGKTTLCANISTDLLQQHIPQFIASVETGHTDYIKRIMSALVKTDWNTGDPVKLDHLRVFADQYLDIFRANSAWLSLYDNRLPVEAIMSDIAYHVEHHGVKVAIIDNLNFLLEVKRANDLLVEMDRVTHELVIFCKRVPVHLIMVMHPKKTDHGRVESEFDIKGSSTAVQEAHNILLWNRPHPDMIKDGLAEEGDRELMIAKMRRKGKYVRKRLMFHADQGVHYREGKLYL